MDMDTVALYIDYIFRLDFLIRCVVPLGIYVARITMWLQIIRFRYNLFVSIAFIADLFFIIINHKNIIYRIFIGNQLIDTR